MKFTTEKEWLQHENGFNKLNIKHYFYYILEVFTIVFVALLISPITVPLSVLFGVYVTFLFFRPKKKKYV